MASGTSPVSPSSPGAKKKFIEYDRFVEEQLRKTRAHVRGVDLASGLMTLAAGFLALLLVAALFDHWVFSGGMGFWGRLVFFFVILAAAVTYLTTQVAPLVFRRINPVYVAETIERGRPSLKNSLVNFLMFRAHREQLPEIVYQAVEEQAANNLAKVQIDSAVDRSKLIKIGYVLLGVLLLGAIYKVASPKDPLTTAGRVMLPWLDIAPPTQVRIEDIQPGDTKIFRGEQLNISAEVRGVRERDEVLVVYSTADGQIVNKPVAMHLPADSYRYQCTLPPGSGGVQQDLTYRLEAGDCVSKTFHVAVSAAPTIVVESIEYAYPEYTGLVTRRVQHQGDIKALEGTRVTIHAVTNQDIKTAAIDFDCDGRSDVTMTGTGLEAKATFTLALKPDRVTPEHTSYQLLLATRSGHRNTQPIRHQIEVTPDIAPEVQLLAPNKDSIEMPLNAALDIEVAANDPDFALRSVKLVAAQRGKQFFSKTLLDEQHRGQFNSKFRFEPRKLGLKAGDEIEYWAAADDVKTPKPNHSETPRRRITITSPSDKLNNQDQLAQSDKQPPGNREGEAPAEPQPNEQPREPKAPPNDKPGQQPNPQNEPQQQPGAREGEAPAEPQPDSKGGDNKDNKSKPDNKQPGDQKQDPNQQQGDQPQEGNQQQPGDKKAGDSKSGEGQSGGPGDKQQNQPVPKDGTDDGSAFDQILKHQQEKDQKNQPQQKGNQQQPGDKQNSQQPGDKQAEGGQPQEKKPADQQKPQPGKPGQGGEQQPTEQGDQAKEHGAKPQPGQQQQPQGPDKPADKTEDGRAPGGKAQPSQGKQKPDGPETNEPGGQGQPGGENDPGAKEAPGQPQGPGEKQKPAAGQGQPKAGDQPNGASQGQGDQAKGNDAQPGQKPDGSREGEAPAEPKKGGDRENEKGQSGAGQPGQDDKGSASPQGANKPRPKSQQSPPGAEQKPDSEPGSPSGSDKQSDSQGESQGDRSGGGKPGGGQKANKPGTGDAGQNTAADEGGGQSKESGKGETSGRKGVDQKSDGATGQAGDEKGLGATSRSKPSQSGEKGQSPEGSGREGAGAQNPIAGGGRKEDLPAGKPGSFPDTGADEANLEYTRKATDLALERLKDQMKKGEPDKELLDKLGWSRADLEAFIRRWEQMRAAAKTPGPQATPAKRELDEALRSLGLRPRSTSLKSNSARDDQARGLKESRRTAPPPEYAEQFKAYTQGTSRGTGK